MRSDNKQGFSRFSIIVFFPGSFFYTVRFAGMLNTQLIIKNPLLLYLLLLKKHAMLGFHTDSLHDSIIVEKYPEYEQSKCNPKKKLFRIATYILPDSIEKIFHAS